MATSTKRIWLDIGLSVMGGVLSYPLAHGFLYVIGYFYSVPTGIATVIFITTYSGVVFVCVYRVWDDVRLLTDDMRILIIYQGIDTAPNGTYLPAPQKLFDDDTYETFQKLLCGFPPEYTVFKFNRLFFLKGISSLPDSKLRYLASNPKAFSQVITRLKNDDYIRTDGFSFSLQLSKWEFKRKEIMNNKPEFLKWQGVANHLVELNNR
ncbi:hypothetical protein ACFL4P_01350 [Gemmatimonadota bacterium]